MGIDPSSEPKATPAERFDESKIETAEISRADTHVEFSSPLQPHAELLLDPLLHLCNSRSCQEAISLVVDSVFELMKCHEQRAIPFHRHGGNLLEVSSPQQFGNLLYIPEGSGTLFVMNDIEGDIGAIEALFREHNILPLMAAGQAQCLFGGDLIDRGRQGSQIFEFLLDLKFKRGFHDSVHILAGNHELSPHIQMSPLQGGFFTEVAEKRFSYDDLGDLESDLAQKALRWHAEFCAEDDFQGFPQLRVALWRLYNELFTRLPKIALTGNGAILCHAGGTAKGPFDYIRDPKEWSTPPSFAEAATWLAGPQFMGSSQENEDVAALEEEHSASQLEYTWSDCSLEHSGVALNRRRGSGLLFGPDALQRFLDLLGRRVLIRGHQKVPPAGAQRLSPHAWTLGDRVITINSVLSEGKFRETENGFTQDFSRQCLMVPLNRQLRSVADLKLIDLSGE